MPLLLPLVLLSAAGVQATPSVEARSDVIEAQRQLARGDLEGARDRFEHALLANPREPDALEGMSSTSEKLSVKARAAGNMDEALDDLIRAQRAEPDDKRILFDLGIQEDEMRLDLDAIATLEHLRRLLPVDPNVWYALGRVNMNLGRLDAAEQMMQAYLAARPQDASAHFGLGSIYLKQLAFDKAREELQRSITLQPKQSEAYYQLGELDLQEDKYEEAMQQYKTALQRDPHHGGALVGIGIAYFKTKRFAEAKEWLVKATEVAPDYQPGHYYLGLTLARLGEREGSSQELALAATMAEKDSRQFASRLRITGSEARP